MIVVFLIVAILYGYSIINIGNIYLKINEISWNQILSVAMPLGFMGITINMFVINFIGVEFSVFNIWINIILQCIILNLLVKYLVKEKLKVNKSINIRKLHILDMFIIIIVIYVCIYAITSVPFLPDEFSHWALQAKNIFIGRRMDLIIDTGFESYPNYIPLLGSSYYFLVGSLQDYSIRIVSSMHLISLILNMYYFTERLKLKDDICKCLVLLFLNSMGVMIDLSSSYYADIIFAMYYSSSIMFFILWYKQNEKKDFVLYIIFMVGATWVKTDGLYLMLGNILVMDIISIKSKKIKIKYILLYTILGLSIIIPWKIYCNTHIFSESRWFLNINTQYLLPMIKNMLIQTFSLNSWGTINIIFVLVMIFSFKNLYKNENLICIMVILGNILFLALGYIIFFGEEAITAASYSRYITRIIPIQIIFILMQYNEFNNKVLRPFNQKY